ncbi:PREDICTED: uncharacterized protein LOC109591265 [Amphimedon queenslandica]|uniref:Uncharacterized protein n=1 Tax=Amphimedon queenslandica TaxID=400682 RepID=A0AAN0JZP8_AMPQE|nr:PREDICTED: uncharacterized protein LOC109591265 [Amphimedon queenslandica]|eukprot:XP_019862590.1 PREDICTED: uncharacterized protein LOC109591265 [Amphimedon queenslandica]
MPYEYDTCVKYYPKLARPQGTNILFERAFIRENVKLFEDKLRNIYQEPESSIFWKEASFIKKHDIGRTNFWPLDYYDMGLEILYYLQALQSDIEKRSVAIPSPIMTRIIIPEILTYLMAKRFNISISKAFLIFKDQSFKDIEL